MTSRMTAFFSASRILMPLAAVCLLALPAYSHQPRLVESSRITVVDPEISKAYYGKLAGEPHIYRIESPQPFALYVNILVPDIPGQDKDVSAAITSASAHLSSALPCADSSTSPSPLPSAQIILLTVRFQGSGHNHNQDFAAV